MSKFLEGLFTKPRQPIGQLPLNRPSNISQRKKAEEVQKWFHLRKCSVIKYSLTPSPRKNIIQIYKHCSTWFLISLIKQKWYLTLYSNRMFKTRDKIIFCIFLICVRNLWNTGPVASRQLFEIFNQPAPQGHNKSPQHDHYTSGSPLSILTSVLLLGKKISSDPLLRFAWLQFT